MKRNFLVAALGATAFVLLCGFSCGRPTPERAKRYVDMRLDDALDDLKANADQKTRIHGIVDGLFPDAVALYQQHKDTRVEVTNLLAEDKVDGVKLHAIADQRIDAFRTFAHKAIDGVIAAHDTLNPTQRAEIIQKAREHQKEE